MATEQRYDSLGRVIKVKPQDEKIYAKDWQKKILFGYFDKDPYPGKDVLQELETKVQLDFHWLRNWYQYQRKRRNIRQDQYFKSLKPKEQIILEGEPELEDLGDSEVGDVSATPEVSSSSTKKMVKSKEWQRDILLEYFARNAYPTREEVAQIESKTQLDPVWIKSWFQTKRKRENRTQKTSPETPSVSSVSSPGQKVTLSEDAQSDESFEKEAEGSDDKTEMYGELKKKFEELQSRYNELAELLLHRSILTGQTDTVDQTGKVPTVDLTESSEGGGQMTHYPPGAVSYPPPHPPQSYPYPHFYPPYYPPQYAQYFPHPPPHPHPPPRPAGPPGSLPYPAMPQ